jgi:hypothetical protein
MYGYEVHKMPTEPPLSATILHAIAKAQDGNPFPLTIAGVPEEETNQTVTQLTKTGFIRSHVIHIEQGADLYWPIELTAKGEAWLKAHPDPWGDEK